MQLLDLLPWFLHAFPWGAAMCERNACWHWITVNFSVQRCVACLRHEQNWICSASDAGTYGDHALVSKSVQWLAPHRCLYSKRAASEETPSRPDAGRRNYTAAEWPLLALRIISSFHPKTTGTDHTAELLTSHCSCHCPNLSCRRAIVFSI